MAATLAAARSKDAHTDVKEALLKELKDLRATHATLEQERSACEVVDPDRYAAMKEAALLARDAANRWLDNTHSLKQWCGKQFQGRESEVDKFFEENGLTDKVDYLE
jgi:hypothetical protein